MEGFKFYSSTPAIKLVIEHPAADYLIKNRRNSFELSMFDNFSNNRYFAELPKFESWRYDATTKEWSTDILPSEFICTDGISGMLSIKRGIKYSFNFTYDNNIYKENNDSVLHFPHFNSQNYSFLVSFIDVSVNDWYGYFVNWLNYFGIVTSDKEKGEEFFSPEKPMKRGKFIKLVISAAQKTGKLKLGYLENFELKYKDASEFFLEAFIPEWGIGQTILKCEDLTSAYTREGHN